MRQPDTIEHSAPTIEYADLLDLTVPTKHGSSVSVRQLSDRFAQSRYGVAMRQQELRFAVNFGYDRDEMLADLGPDVCPIGHQQQYLEFLQTTVDSERRDNTLLLPSAEDLATLALAGSIHDIGESLHQDVEYFCGDTLGDLPAGTKTQADKELESAIRHFMYYALFDDIDPKVTDRVEAIVSHHDDTILHDLYEAAHNLQTLNTAQRAERSLMLEATRATLDPDDQRLIALQGMVNSVMPDVKQKLQSYRYFTAIDHQLDQLKNGQSAYDHFLTADNAEYHKLCCPTQAGSIN